MPLISYEHNFPKLAQDVFIAADAYVIGNVEVRHSASVWYKSVLRGERGPIVVGAFSNIQESCSVEGGEADPCLIGNYVTVGHGAILRECIIGDYSLIGMGSIIGKGVKIGENCMIGAGTAIAEGRVIPANSLVAGAAGRVIRKVTEAEITAIQYSALGYHKLSLQYCLK